MRLIDVHCHLNHELFKKDLNEVIRRAEQAGIKAIWVSGVNPAANKEVLFMDLFNWPFPYPRVRRLISRIG